MMFGAGSKWLTLPMFPEYEGFLLAILRPRAFMGLVVLIALKHRIDRLQRERAPAGIIVQPAQPASAA